MIMILNNNNNKFKQRRELEFSFPLSLKHRRNFPPCLCDKVLIMALSHSTKSFVIYLD